MDVKKPREAASSALSIRAVKPGVCCLRHIASLRTQKAVYKPFPSSGKFRQRQVSPSAKNRTIQRRNLPHMNQS